MASKMIYCLVIIGFGHIVLSLSVSHSHSYYNLLRKSCRKKEDCNNKFKECIDGLCHCNSTYDDVLENEENDCMLSYGSTCTKPSNILCNVHKHLDCSKIKNVCVCYHSHMIYDEQLETCVSLLGDECELNTGDQYGMSLKGCIRNAECRPDPKREVDKEFYGICECVNGYVNNREGRKCVPELGSKCAIDSDCDDGGVVCLKGKCSCSKQRLHDKHEHKCKLKVGFGCEIEPENCVEGAKCILISENNKWGWECLCDAGFHENNGTCIKDQFETCKNGEAFEEKRGRCSITVGNKCKTNGPSRCIKHAFCSGTEFTCQCFEGYRKTNDDFCDKEKVMTSITTNSTTTMKTTELKMDSAEAEANHRIDVSLTIQLYPSLFLSTFGLSVLLLTN